PMNLAGGGDVPIHVRATQPPQLPDDPLDLGREDMKSLPGAPTLIRANSRLDSCHHLIAEQHSRVQGVDDQGFIPRAKLTHNLHLLLVNSQSELDIRNVALDFVEVASSVGVHRAIERSAVLSEEHFVTSPLQREPPSQISRPCHDLAPRRPKA